MSIPVAVHSHTVPAFSRMSASSKITVKASLNVVRKGRVLLLHGWAQNAAVMRIKAKSLTKKLNRAGYDCVFLEAPHVLPMQSTIVIEGFPVLVDNGSRENARAWFLYSDTDAANATLSQSGEPLTYVGLEETWTVIENELMQPDTEPTVDGVPFCAVLGFSQGAVLVHLLSILTTRLPRDSPFRRINACLLASGFAAQHVSKDMTSPYHTVLGNIPADQSAFIEIPSLHLIGKNDTSVEPKASAHLAQMYSQPMFLDHEKGHILPQHSDDCARIVAFLDEARAETNL